MNGYIDCTNAHWFWLWPAGWIIFPIIFILISRFWWWGGYWRHHRNWSGYDGQDAAEILRQRYAKGEITKEEFEQMRADLKSSK